MPPGGILIHYSLRAPPGGPFQKLPWRLLQLPAIYPDFLPLPMNEVGRMGESKALVWKYRLVTNRLLLIILVTVPDLYLPHKLLRQSVSFGRREFMTPLRSRTHQADRHGLPGAQNAPSEALLPPFEGEKNSQTSLCPLAPHMWAKRGCTMTVVHVHYMSHHVPPAGFPRG